MSNLENKSLDTLLNIRTNSVRSDHEIEILKYLFEKYKCRSVSDEAKGTSRQTVYNRIKSGKIASIEMNNKTFVIF